MDRAEADAARPQIRRFSRRLWAALVAAAVAAGLAVGYTVSFALGFAVGVALGLAGFEVWVRLVRRWWIRRFPELAGPRTQWPTILRRRGSRGAVRP